MKALVALLPPDAYTSRKPTAEELALTYPPAIGAIRRRKRSVVPAPTSDRRPTTCPTNHSCELCEATPFTEWFHSDELCWIAECDACAVPMVVWRVHDPDPPAEIREPSCTPDSPRRSRHDPPTRTGSMTTCARSPTTTTPTPGVESIGPTADARRRVHAATPRRAAAASSAVPARRRADVDRARRVGRRHLAVHRRRVLLRRTLPRPPDAAWRADVRGDRPGRCRRRARRSTLRRQAAVVRRTRQGSVPSSGRAGRRTDARGRARPHVGACRQGVRSRAGRRQRRLRVRTALRHRRR